MTIQELINNKILNQIYQIYQQEKNKDIKELYLDIKIYGKDLSDFNLGPKVLIGVNHAKNENDKHKFHTTNYNINYKELNLSNIESKELVEFINSAKINLNIIFLDITNVDILIHIKTIGAEQQLMINTNTGIISAKINKFSLIFDNVNISSFYINTINKNLNNFKLINSNMHYFEISNSILKGEYTDLQFQNNIINNFKIGNDSVINGINFFQNEIDRFSIFGTEIYDLNIREDNIKSLHIESSSNINKLGNISIFDSYIEELKLAHFQKINQDLLSKIIINQTIITNIFSIIDCNCIDVLKIKGSNNISQMLISGNSFLKESEIFLNNLCISNLRINSVANLTDSFKITSVEVTEKFILEDVDFGKIIFNGLNLAESELNFKHVTFNNCIFNNVIWNKDCIIKNSNDEELRDLYRQMKFIMDKLGDTITGSKFYRNEMEVQKNIVSGNNKKDNLNIFFWWRKSERFVFWFGYNINNFGQNWMKPIIILFILNFILWCFNYSDIWIDGFQNINNIFSIKYWDNFWFNFSSYISYLTPFRKLSEHPSFFDILARITSTILIYQAAVALRRKIQR